MNGDRLRSKGDLPAGIRAPGVISKTEMINNCKFQGLGDCEADKNRFFL